MKYYYVYIVRCSDDSFYVGITNDVDKREGEHNAGIDPSSYTYSRRPVRVIYVEYFCDPNQAIAREKQLKGWSRKKKEALINGNCKELIVRSRRKRRRDWTIKK